MTSGSLQVTSAKFLLSLARHARLQKNCRWRTCRLWDAWQLATQRIWYFFFLSCCKQLEILLMSSSELCCLTIVNKVLYVRREQHLVPIRETKQVHMSTRRYKKWLHSENILFHCLKQAFFVIVVCFLNFLPIYCLILLYVFKLHVWSRHALELYMNTYNYIIISFS